uniref:Non-structural protein 3b n=3 Tax=Avian coronavirus TaxID=694014 RepID=NS3B_IBVM|nr:RecName: Full=Non-structural protein 3b; Short=ns3b; AltName: Full=Accessory protein 3b [Avian infectious bronchitis virus (strain M41)]AAT70075.1 3a protein [Infectious bronchitis virus]ACV87252.1 ORF 3b [Turkey coronavirus]AAU09492.1 3b protein [Infectious bronchitis virus]AAW33788.1 3b [Infectious bronchitis virus]ABI26425.1 3b [Infectious bronchitis virus]
MLNLEAIIETGEQVIQKISFNLQHISSVLNTEVFDPFDYCYYRGGNFWEIESAEDCSGDDEFIE